MVKNSKEAFIWIVSILRKEKIPFQISGGLAAKIYGSKRKLEDIDIELKNKSIHRLEPIVKKFIIKKPSYYQDKEFNLLLMTLKFKGQNIDLSGTENEKIFNKKENKWETEKIDLSKSIKKGFWVNCSSHSNKKFNFI